MFIKKQTLIDDPGKKNIMGATCLFCIEAHDTTIGVTYILKSSFHSYPPMQAYLFPGQPNNSFFMRDAHLIVPSLVYTGKPQVA